MQSYEQSMVGEEAVDLDAVIDRFISNKRILEQLFYWNLLNFEQLPDING